MSRWPLLYAWWFLEVSSPKSVLYPLKFVLTERLTNDDDDDDDDGLTNAMAEKRSSWIIVRARKERS